MRIRWWVTLVLAVPLALLAAANWSELLTPVEIDVFLFSVRWPLWPFVVGIPVLLVVLYLGAALLDRARQLRQVAALERQLEEARRDLDRGREAAIDALGDRLQGHIAALESAVEGAVSGLEQRLAERVESVDEHVGRVEEEQRTRGEALAARVAAVRDEIAADVGEAEDALLRALRGRDEAGRAAGEPATAEVERVHGDDVRPALPGVRRP
jgi:hypothetical protein